MGFTKADLIFYANYREAIRRIEKCGVDAQFDAFDSLYKPCDCDYIRRRAVEAVLKKCDEEESRLCILAKIGASFGKYPEEVQRKAISVVRNTCENRLKGKRERKAI